MAKGKKIKKRLNGDPRRREINVPARKLKRRRGSERPHKLTPPCKLTLTARKIVYAAVEMGMPIYKCYALINVSKMAWNNYLNYGKDPRYSKFYHFRNKLHQLEKERQVEALKVIRTSAKGGFKVKKTKITIESNGKTSTTTEESTLAPQWQAAAWFLERKDRKNWGRDAGEEEQKSAVEIAQDIQDAQMALMNSVPTSE